MTPRVLISTSSFGGSGEAPLDSLRRAGIEPRLNPHGRKLTPEESCSLLGDVDGLIAGTERLDAQVLAAAPSLKVISRVGTGMDNVDLDAARRRGIQVFNTPDAHVDAVAELTLGGLLALARHVARSDRGIRQGDWPRPMGRLLQGATVGLVGFGRVGQRVAQLLQPFGVRLLVTDPQPDEAAVERLGAGLVSLDVLLAEAGVVSLHTPGTGGAPLLDAAALAAMRPDVLIVNTARGTLIDESALDGFLADHPQAGAYLDVFAQEPYQGSLSGRDNVLLSAHMGSYAREARLGMEQQAVDNLLVGLGLAPS